jgi:hypothetical protein
MANSKTKRNHFKKLFTQEFIIEHYINQRKTVQEIAKEFQSTKKTVSYYIKSYNIVIRRNGMRIIKSDLEFDVYELDLTIKQMTDKYNLGKGRIGDLLKEFNIDYQSRRCMTKKCLEASIKKRLTTVGEISGYYLGAIKRGAR